MIQDRWRPPEMEHTAHPLLSKKGVSAVRQSLYWMVNVVLVVTPSQVYPEAVTFEVEAV